MADERDHLSDMIMEWAPLINLHASKLKKGGLLPHIDEEDLHSHGMHGLIDAFHKYNPQRGSFANYAGIRIKNKMKDFISSSGGVNMVDNYHYKQAKKFMNSEKAKQTKQEPPSGEES
jgi:DNA-directed RNA polymerase specialized sigma subunit